MKRYGPPGSRYNSKKYLAMHNANISKGLRRYWENKKNNGKITGEQVLLVWCCVFSIFFMIVLFCK